MKQIVIIVVLIAAAFLAPASARAASSFVPSLYTDLSIPPTSTNGTFNGVTVTMTVSSGASQSSFGQAMYVNNSGELDTADATAAGASPIVCLLVTSGTGSGKKCLLLGFATNTSWSWTVGGMIYLSTAPATATGLTQTVPSSTNNQVQAIGVAVASDTILVEPLTLVEHK